MKKIITLIVIASCLLLAYYFFFKKDSVSSQTSQPTSSESESPRIVSTKPDSLENSIVSADGIFEITFNRPLENIGEFKVRIEPQIEFKKELSSDRKTGKITPAKTLELGTGYTIFIGPDTKFDGVGAWGQEKTFHFRTVKYSGV